MDSNDPLYFAVTHTAFSSTNTVFVCNPPRERSEPPSTESWGLGIDSRTAVSRDDPDLNFYSDLYVPASKPPRRRANSKPAEMVTKRRSTVQSILVPNFLQGTSSTPASPEDATTSFVSSPGSKRTSRIRAHSTASVSGRWSLLNHQQQPLPHPVASPLPVTPASPPPTITSPRDSPPPDFLLDDDPFANLTAAPAVTRNTPHVSPPQPLPVPEKITSPPTPRSPLTPSQEIHSPSMSRATDLTSDLDLKRAHPPRAFTTRVPVAAHQRPAFGPRPSLPSLSTLAQMNVVLTKKPRKGRVGAGLPFEPWDNPNCELPPRVLQDIHASSTQSLPVGTQPLLPSQIVEIATKASGVAARLEGNEVPPSHSPVPHPLASSPSVTCDESLSSTPSALSRHVPLQEDEPPLVNNDEVQAPDVPAKKFSLPSSASSSDSGHLVDSYYSSGSSSDIGHGEEEINQPAASDEREQDEITSSFAVYQQYQHYSDLTDFDTDTTTTTSNSCDEFSPPPSSRVSSLDLGETPETLPRSISSNSSLHQPTSSRNSVHEEDATIGQAFSRMSAVIALENQLRISLDGIQPYSTSTSGTRSSLDDSESLRSPLDSEPFPPFTLSPKSSFHPTPSLTSSSPEARVASSSSSSSPWTPPSVVAPRSPSYFPPFSSLFGGKKKSKKSSTNSSLDYVSSWRDQSGREMGAGAYLSDADLNDPFIEPVTLAAHSSQQPSSSSQPTVPEHSHPYTCHAADDTAPACTAVAGDSSPSALLGSPVIAIPPATPTFIPSPRSTEAPHFSMLMNARYSNGLHDEQVWPSSADTVRPAPLSANGIFRSRSNMAVDDDGSHGVDELSLLGSRVNSTGEHESDASGGSAVMMEEHVALDGQMRRGCLESGLLEVDEPARRAVDGGDSGELGFDRDGLRDSSISSVTASSTRTTTTTASTAATSSIASLSSNLTSVVPATFSTSPSRSVSVSGSLSSLSGLSALAKSTSSRDGDLGSSTSSKSGVSVYREHLHDEDFGSSSRNTRVLEGRDSEGLEFDLDLEEMDMLRYQPPRASAASTSSMGMGGQRMMVDGTGREGGMSTGGYRSRSQSHSNQEFGGGQWGNGATGRYHTVGGSRRNGAGGDDEDEDGNEDRRRRLHRGPESLAYGAYQHRKPRASTANSEDEGEFGAIPRVPQPSAAGGVNGHQAYHMSGSPAPSSYKYGAAHASSPGGHSTGSYHGATRFPVASASNSSSDDDDVPLAQRIPTALVAQKSIRRQVREERAVKKLERAATSASKSSGRRDMEQQMEGAFSRDRHATLRPAGAGGGGSGPMGMSSSQEAAMLAVAGGSAAIPPPPPPVVPSQAPLSTSVGAPGAISASVPTERKTRQRTMTMPSKPGPPSTSPNPFSAEDLAKRLQNVQLAAEQQQIHQGLSSAPVGGTQQPPSFQPSHRPKGSFDSGDRGLARGRTMKEYGSAHPREGSPTRTTGTGLRHMRSFQRERRHVDEWGAQQAPPPPPPPALPSDVERQAALQRQLSRSASRAREEASPGTTRKRSLSVSRAAPGSPHGYGGVDDGYVPPVPPLPSASVKGDGEHVQRKLYKAGRVSGEGVRPERSPGMGVVALPGGSGGAGAVQQRVFVGDLQRFNMVEMTSSTTAGDVVDMIEALGSLKGIVGAGGWMVFEVAQDFGMERPIRSFELLSDVQASWNKDKMVNLFVLKQTPLANSLSRNAIPTSSPIYSGYVEWEQKRGKWSKRWMVLREHSLHLAKREGKEEVLLCSLSNFDAYFISRSHRAPKPFAFAVKSTDSLTFFENAADYLHNFACNEKEGRIWMEKILVARSYVLQQERQVLFNPKAAGGNASAAVSRANTTRKSTSQRPAAPLVSVPPIAFSNQPLPQHGKQVFEPGSLLHSQP